MKTITKKRSKAVLIDAVIASAASGIAEAAFKRKGNAGFFYAVVLPTAAMWGLEVWQLKKHGQTPGYRQAGLVLESADGRPLTTGQLLKRAAYRDTLSTLEYLKDRNTFEQQEGAVLPHDAFAGTIVRQR